MSVLAIILIVICFFKSFYYGLYEIKQKQNKPGGIAVCLFAILRTYLSYCGYFLAIYFINNMIFINFEMICGDRSKIITIFDFVIIFREREKFYFVKFCSAL